MKESILKNKKKIIACLIAALVIIGYKNYKHKDIHIEENIPAEVQVVNNSAINVAGAAKTEAESIVNNADVKLNTQDNSKYLGLENELIEAKLITGVEYYISENQKNQLRPALINFKYKEMDCSAFGEIETSNQKSKIRLNYAKCDNDELEIKGQFFDGSKDLGSTVTYSPDNQKYVVAPQDGFILLGAVSQNISIFQSLNPELKTNNAIPQNIEISNNDISTLKLLNAELKTSTLIPNDESELLQVLITFDNNGMACNSIGDISLANGLSSISLKNTKCGDQKYPELRGWFVSSNKMLNPYEVYDDNNEKTSVPLQTGFVLLR